MYNRRFQRSRRSYDRRKGREPNREKENQRAYSHVDYLIVGIGWDRVSSYLQVGAVVLVDCIPPLSTRFSDASIPR